MLTCRRADPAATLEFGNGSQQGPGMGQALGLLARLDRVMNAAMTVGAILAVVGVSSIAPRLGSYIVYSILAGHACL